ncbi:unnamed protein product [Urochloa decumbens]|uniref:F-box domain-containing protein n=1 Tax=Urochloa decumbens TaxID=240449 RepID=A0ABC9BRN8_9POAL
MLQVPVLTGARTQTSIHDVPDDLLETILLRVSSPVHLARAGAACKLWRRVIADGRFAARFRSMHAPAVAGYYFNSFRSFRRMPGPSGSIRPSFDPSPSTGIDPRYFSLDFLSDDVIAGTHSAIVLDSRGSLLLIEFEGLRYFRGSFPAALVVCEPLTQRYEKIPRPRDFDGGCTYLRSYLVDGKTGCDDPISMSSFRVLCDMYRGGVAHAAMFTAGGSEDSWSEKAIDHVSPVLDHTRLIKGRAGGCWYFYIQGMTWIVLDGATGEYSSLDLPTTVDWGLNGDYTRMHRFYVAEGRDGKPRIFSFKDNTVKVFARLGGDGEWALERSLLLRYHEHWDTSVWAKGPGFIVVALEVSWVNEHVNLRQLLSVDLETMEVKPAEEDKFRIHHPCTLPCPPTLRACLDG